MPLGKTGIYGGGVSLASEQGGQWQGFGTVPGLGNTNTELLTQDSHRVGLIFAFLSGVSPVYCSPDPSTKLNRGIPLSKLGDTIELVYSDYGKLVQRAWFAFSSSPFTLYVIESGTQEWFR